jgi:hypothetical protein
LIDRVTCRRSVAAEYAIFLQDAQQPGLERNIQVRNLVEKQYATKNWQNRSAPWQTLTN